MYKIYRDSPKENASHFNFNIYADSLSKIILNNENKTPFTIAINGKWGSGKSTLMKTLKKKLEDESGIDNNRKIKTVWFDAWKYSECDSMFSALICEILGEMERQDYLSKLKAKSLLGLQRVNVLKIMSDTAKMLSAGELEPEFENWVGKKAYEEKLSFYDLFQDYMKEILQTFVLEKTDGIYTDKEGVLVIFIDDLDRCPPSNITAVLESINLFLDQEGCFFIIGTDISIIAKAIEAKYKDVEDFSGIEYIKKIIQLKFDLPLLKENDIEYFMQNELQIDSKLDEYLDIIVKGLKKNQREIIRFLNTINLMRILGASLESKDASPESKFVYKEELLIKWNILDFSSPTFIDEIKRKNDVLFEIQNIARMKDEERDDWIQSLKEEGKENYHSYCQNKKIIDVLSSGKEQFNQNNIGTYLFLSSITPKDIRLDTIKPEARLVGEDLKGADLAEANLRGADLLKANLEEANLRRADLRMANLMEANLMEANLMEANLMEANLMEANLLWANLEGADLRGADLEGAALQETNLERANLEGANLEGADLRGADLGGANLKRANLEEANLERAHLEGVDFEGAKLEGANLLYANLRKAKNLSVEQLPHEKFLHKVKLDEDLRKKIENKKRSLAEKVSSTDTLAAGTIYVGDTTYAGTDFHDIIGLGDDKFIEMNETNFAGFISGEKLKIYGGSFVDDRNIKKGGLVYETQIKQIDFKSNAWEDTYKVMGLFGDVYVLLKNNTPDKLTKLLVDSGDKYTLRVGSALELAGGYELTAKQIDVVGNKVWMEFSKNGEFIEDKVITVGDNADGTWIFATNIADETDVEVMKVRVTNTFQGQVDSLVVVEGIWLINFENILEIETGDKFDVLKVDRIADSSIIMVNGDSIHLTRNSMQEIAEGIKFKVADSDDLTFNLIREYV